MLQLCNMAEKNDVRLTVKSDMQSTLMSQWLMDFKVTNKIAVMVMSMM